MGSVENTPKMNLNIHGNNFEATPNNTSLFMFLGELASRNHIFLQTGKTEDETIMGTYIFSMAPGFDAMRQYMMRTGYPLHLNLRDVAECDEKAYRIALGQLTERDAGNVPDFIPDDWQG